VAVTSSSSSSGKGGSKAAITRSSVAGGAVAACGGVVEAADSAAQHAKGGARLGTRQSHKPEPVVLEPAGPPSSAAGRAPGPPLQQRLGQSLRQRQNKQLITITGGDLLGTQDPVCQGMLKNLAQLIGKPPRTEWGNLKAALLQPIQVADGDSGGQLAARGVAAVGVHGSDAGDAAGAVSFSSCSGAVAAAASSPPQQQPSPSPAQQQPL
jgi:hypothetical protein